MAAVELEDIEKSYPSPDGGALVVLRLSRLAIAPGERLAVAGRSGTGKTTLLNLIAGVTTPTAGNVWVDGQPINRLPEPERDRYRAGRIGIVFQTFNLLPQLTALENVVLPMGFADRVPSGQRRARGASLLAELDLGDRVDHRPAQLSAGQQQRVAIARALANRPTLVLADEPTASVDPETAGQVMALLEATCGARDATLIVASHDPEVLRRFPRVLRLEAAAPASPGVA